jgi:hypothetical protein
MERENHDEDTFVEVDMLAVRYFTPSYNPRLTLTCESCGLRTSTGFRVDTINGREGEGGEPIYDKHSVILCWRCFQTHLEAALNDLVLKAESLMRFRGDL